MVENLCSKGDKYFFSFTKFDCYPTVESLILGYAMKITKKKKSRLNKKKKNLGQVLGKYNLTDNKRKNSTLTADL